MKKIFYTWLLLFFSFGEVVAGEHSATFPQLEFDTYGSQVFWFVISFASLFILLKTYFIPKISGIKAKRQQKIILNYSKSEQIKNELVNCEKQTSFNKKEIKNMIAKNNLIKKQQKKELQQQMEQKVSEQIMTVVKKYSKETSSSLNKQRSMAKENVEIILQSLLKNYNLDIDNKKFTHYVDEIVENYTKKFNT